MTVQAPTAEQIRHAWNVIAPGFDEFVTPETVRVGEELVRRVDVRPGVRFLDVAAGSGAVAIPAARLGAEVVATDIAVTMIEALNARAHSEGLSNLHGQVMDALALDLGNDTFDVSASLNGVSLLPDLAGGLTELIRVTRPGGRVVIGAFGALQKAEFIAYFMGAVQATVPGFSPSAGPLRPSFQLAEPEVFRQRLGDAGLTDVSVETVTWDMRIGSAAHFWNVVTSSNPIGAQVAAGLTPEQQEQVRQVLDGMLRERSGGEPGAVLHADINIGVGTK